MWKFITSIFRPIMKPINTMVEGSQKRASAKLEGDIAITKAKTASVVKMAEAGQAADIDWEILSVKNSGWKDEWFTILLSIPMVLCFIPGMDTYVKAGFESLKTTPDWYQWAFGVAVGSSFGYRKIADFMGKKKGAK